MTEEEHIRAAATFMRRNSQSPAGFFALLANLLEAVAHNPTPETLTAAAAVADFLNGPPPHTPETTHP